MFNPDALNNNPVGPDSQKKDEVDEVIGELEEEEKLKKIARIREEAGKERPSERGEVLPKKFQEILTSGKFSNALGTIAEITNRNGHETRFGVDLFQKGDFFISNLEEGLTSGINYDELPRVVKEAELGLMECANRNINEKMCNFFSFHFHPEESGLICPSFMDLTHSLPFTEVEGVGSITKKGVIKILLIKKPDTPFPEDLEDTLDSIEPRTPQIKVQKVLRDNGLANTLISFAKKNGKYKLSEASKNALEKFGAVSATFENSKYIFK